TVLGSPTATPLAAQVRHAPTTKTGQEGPKVTGLDYATRPAPTPRKIKPKLLAFAALLVGALTVAVVYSGTIVRFAKNQGVLIVDIDDPNVVISVSQNQVIVADKTTMREFTLTPGPGEIEVFDKSSGVKVATQRFVISRGGKEAIVVALADRAA